MPSNELKFRLHSLVFDIHCEVARYHCIIDFNAIFNILESVFAVKLDVQLNMLVRICRQVGRPATL